MTNKIGTFFMFMMVLCAVLILMATAAREPYTTPTETPAATTVPAGTIQPEPSAVQTQPTIQEDHRTRLYVGDILYAEVLNPGTCDRELIGYKAFRDVLR